MLDDDNNDDDGDDSDNDDDVVDDASGGGDGGDPPNNTRTRVLYVMGRVGIYSKEWTEKKSTESQRTGKQEIWTDITKSTCIQHARSLNDVLQL